MACSQPGFITGIKREAALIPSPHLVLCSGANSHAAALAARRLADQGCDLLVSFGLAGGLDPALPAGTLLTPKDIIAPSREPFACWSEIDFPNAVTKPLAGSDLLLSSPEDKALLMARSGAVAVDMESHAVAYVARERGLPFLVLRAVADTADMTLPAFIAKSTGPDGSTRLGPILMGLLKSPKSLPELLALAKASDLAFAALRSALPLLLKK